MAAADSHGGGSAKENRRPFHALSPGADDRERFRPSAEGSRTCLTAASQQARQIQARWRAYSGTWASREAGKRTAKHQQRSFEVSPAASRQALGAPQRGHFVGSTGTGALGFTSAMVNRCGKGRRKPLSGVAESTPATNEPALAGYGTCRISGGRRPTNWSGSRWSIEPGAGDWRATWPSQKITLAFHP